MTEFLPGDVIGQTQFRHHGPNSLRRLPGSVFDQRPPHRLVRIPPDLTMLSRLPDRMTALSLPRPLPGLNLLCRLPENMTDVRLPHHLTRLSHQLNLSGHMIDLSQFRHHDPNSRRRLPGSVFGPRLPHRLPGRMSALSLLRRRLSENMTDVDLPRHLTGLRRKLNHSRPMSLQMIVACLPSLTRLPQDLRPIRIPHVLGLPRHLHLLDRFRDPPVGRRVFS
jgi:hypothetical protein